jgi:anti-sigma B factor antagonist
MVEPPVEEHVDGAVGEGAAVETAGAEVVHGELDLTNAESLDRALSSATSSVVIVDLTGLRFIDSAGMRTIDHAHRRLAGAGRSLLIVAPSESTAGWTLKIAGFGGTFVAGSLELAMRRATEVATGL